MTVRSVLFAIAIVGAFACGLLGIVFGLVAVIASSPVMGVATGLALAAAFTLMIAALHLQSDEEEWW